MVESDNWFQIVLQPQSQLRGWSNLHEFQFPHLPNGDDYYAPHRVVGTIKWDI